MSLSKNSPYNNLLIIDDNEAIHKDFQKIFYTSNQRDDLDRLDAELFGEDATATDEPGLQFELQFASQGKEGLEILKQNYAEGVRFGAAFVDMRMPPGWGGVETIEQLWKVDPDLQVVICTAFSDKNWDEIVQQLGQSDQLLILKKPFDEIEIVQLATSLTTKRRLLEMSKQRMQNLEQVVESQENELKQVHQDAESIVSSIRSALISLDEQGAVSRWNRVAERLFEIPESEALGVPVWRFADCLAGPIRLAASTQPRVAQ